MRRRLLASAGLAGASVGTALMADVVDRQRVEADPEWERLQTDPPGKSVELTGAGGTRLHAVHYGPEDGPIILLLHGWTCSLRVWRRQVQDLAADHRVIAYDVRGHGRSAAPEDGDWSLDTLADDLEAVFDACVGDGRQAVLAGHSLGAMTIAAWGGRHRGLVSRRAGGVAMINTGLGDLISEALFLQAPDALSRVRELVGRALLGAGAPLPAQPNALTHRIVRYIALSSSASPAAVRFTEEMVLSCDASVRAGSGRELSDMDLLDRVEHLTVPTLVMAGTDDLLTPPAHADKLAEALPDCVGVVKLEGSGHMGPLERPAEVSAALRDLVARVH